MYYPFRVKEKQVIVVVGTRPEAIKLFPVLVELRTRKIRHTLISTGQQSTLLSETLSDLNLIPDINLDLMKNDQTVESFYIKAVEQIGLATKDISSAFTVVQGDTSSALAGSMSSYFNNVPIGHVEAGLRSHDLKSPWPEEGNRRMIDSVSNELWVPTTNSLVSHDLDQRCTVVGNTVVDTLRLIIDSNREFFRSASPKHILVTLHRRESFGEVLVEALRSIGKLSQEISIPIIFLQHPNPNVSRAVDEAGLNKTSVKIIQPLAYKQFIKLLSESILVITDSGGLQEETATLGIPVLVMREKTERSEALSLNGSQLIGFNEEVLIDTTKQIIQNRIGIKPKLDLANSPFGNGFASKLIVDQIEDWI